LVEASLVEFFWTIFPIVVLFIIGLPRIFILYYHEVEFERDITIKITGHQWYWRYDYSILENVEFDSFMLPIEDLQLGDFRLLEVDNHIVVP
jgi:heme/copper-type cytochrome/quinol oxidase subunit 2